MTVSTCVWITGAAPVLGLNVSTAVMRMFFFFRIAVRSAFLAAALGLTVIVTVPAAAKLTLPLPYVTFFGRHFPPSRVKPALHFPFAAANTPKVRFGNVSTQLSVPGSLTCSLSVIVKLGECRVALTALKVAILALGAGDGGGVLGGEETITGACTVKGCCPPAGRNSALPPWVAAIVHVPTPTKLTTEPDTEHTDGFAEEKDTASPDVATALTE